MDAYSLGQVLREAREANEITIEDAVAALRIRQPILAAFEAGEFEIAGVPEIQVRGMLRIYGRYLALEEEDVLQLYDQMRIAQEKGRRGRRRRRASAEGERGLSSTQPMQEMQLAERRSSTCGSLLRILLLLLFSAAALAIIVYVTIELVGIDTGGSPAPGAEATVPPPAATEAPPAADTSDTVASAPTASGRAQYGGSGILVSLFLTQRSWLSVQVDGVEQFSGIAAPETLLEYNAVSEVRLAAANAMALDLIWNGQQQGQIGGRGQRADIRFTATDAIVELGPAGAPTPVAPTADAAIVAAEAGPAATERPSPMPVDTLIPRATPIPPATNTPWPTVTPLPSATPTPGPPTAILPPRVTQAGLIPTKEGA